MVTYQNIVHSFKNLVKMNNVYDCARPILLFLGLFGVGPSKIMDIDGVHSLHNTRYSIIMAIVTAMWTPWWLEKLVVDILFSGERRSLFSGIAYISVFLQLFLLMVTVSVGCIMTHVCCKDLDKVFQIINHIDTKLQEEHVKIKYWKTTLAVTVLGVVTASYVQIMFEGYALLHADHSVIIVYVLEIIYIISFHLHYVLVILFLLIIYDRFVSANKLLLQNVNVTNIQIVESRNLRDDYLLRRISVVRDIDEQLSQAIVLFSNVFRYIIAGLLMHPTVATLCTLIFGLFEPRFAELLYYVTMFIHCLRIVIMISICQAYKNQRKVLAARLRYLIAHETDLRITQQVQQYILYSTTSATGLIDFQFSGVDNILLFTIIDIIVSNVLIIYSYYR